MSMPPNSGKYAYCAASHADGRSIPAHRQRRQPETRRLPAIGWSACGGKPETVRSKGFSNGVYLVQNNLNFAIHVSTKLTVPLSAFAST